MDLKTKQQENVRAVFLAKKESQVTRQEGRFLRKMDEIHGRGVTRYSEGNGNPLQYPCLEYPMGGGAWQVTVHGAAKSWTRLSDFTFLFPFQNF